MTTLKRRVLTSSLAAAGLLLSSGMTLAADLDVSSIYGRGSPQNAHITAASTPAVTQARSTVAADSASEYRGATASEPVISQAYPEHASRTTYPGDTAGQDTYARNGATIHEGNLDGTPLVEGRGMREGVDQYATAPVHSTWAFDVADILGRASPPAPANAPDFGHPS
jgi:hypothetical protein